MARSTRTAPQSTPATRASRTARQTRQETPAPVETPKPKTAADIVRSRVLLPTKKADRTTHLLKELAVLDGVPTDATYPLYVDQVGANSITRLRSADHRLAVRGRIAKALVKVKATVPADPHATPAPAPAQS